MKYGRVFTVVALTLVTVSSFLPSYSQQPPPYIQPGLRFVYQLFDPKTRQQENVFHKYTIETVSAQEIVIFIDSDIMNDVRLRVSPSGELEPGNRIDLWLHPNARQGEKFALGGKDVVVLQTGYDIGQGLKVTVVASLDQSIIWMYIEDGPQQLSQLRGLLLGIVFTKTNKAVGLINIEQAGPVTTTSSYTTVKTTARQTAYTTQRTSVIQKKTETIIETVVSTVTTVETRTETTVRTFTTSTAATVTAEVRADGQPVFPIPLAAGVAVAVVGIAAFLSRSRRRPLPPTYPYPPYQAPPPPPQPAAPPSQIVGYCPACRFPLYAGDIACRRCGFRYG